MVMDRWALLRRSSGSPAEEGSEVLPSRKEKIIWISAKRASTPEKMTKERNPSSPVAEKAMPRRARSPDAVSLTKVPRSPMMAPLFSAARGTHEETEKGREGGGGKGKRSRFSAEEKRREGQEDTRTSELGLHQGGHGQTTKDVEDHEEDNHELHHTKVPIIGCAHPRESVCERVSE